jgi:hypothetical protein
MAQPIWQETCGVYGRRCRGERSYSVQQEMLWVNQSHGSAQGYAIHITALGLVYVVFHSGVRIILDCTDYQKKVSVLGKYFWGEGKPLSEEFNSGVPSRHHFLPCFRIRYSWTGKPA